MSSFVRLGRALVIAVMAYTLIVSILSIYLQASVNGFGKLPIYSVRFFVNVLLVSYIYRGYELAKWIYIVLVGLVGLIAFGWGLFITASWVVIGALLFLGAGYMMCALLLFKNKAVNAFLAFQWGAHTALD